MNNESNKTQSPMLDRDETAGRLCRLAAEQVQVDLAEVRLESRLVEDLGFDSLDQLEFAMEIEEEFEVSIPDEIVERVKTIKDALDALMENKKTQRDPSGNPLREER